MMKLNHYTVFSFFKLFGSLWPPIMIIGWLGFWSNFVQATPFTGVKQIGTGAYHTCAIDNNDQVWCWGENNYGQLGDGTTTLRALPVKVEKEAAAVALGGNHTCILTTAGGVRCWGHNFYGQLGNGSTTDSFYAKDVIGLERAVLSISVGQDHSCALIAGGEVQCWGRNQFGQLGNDTSGITSNQREPVTVDMQQQSVIGLSAGQYHTCAVTDNHEVKCWGNNGSGQLGDNSLINRAVPVTVNGLAQVESLATGQLHTCAVTSSNEGWCWGNNLRGQLGIVREPLFADKDSLVPELVSLADQITHISAGYQHTCAIISSGEVQCWGDNEFGQIGIGEASRASLEPVLTPGLTEVTEISLGQNHSCVIRQGGALWCWGDNSHSQLGDGSDIRRDAPVAVEGGSSTPLSNVINCEDSAPNGAWGVPPNECAALVALYQATNGDHWSNHTNWNTSAPIADWFGVEVNQEGHVTGLKLVELQLSGTLPAELGDLEYLQTLYLGRNQLSGPLPDSVGNLTELTELYLDGNQLSGTLPPTLGALQNLHILELDSNQFTGKLPHELGNMSALTMLSLGKNQFTGAVPEAWSTLSQLTDLYLDNNQLSGDTPSATLDEWLSGLSTVTLYKNCIAPTNSAIQATLDAKDPQWRTQQQTTCPTEDIPQNIPPMVSVITISGKPQVGQTLAGSYTIIDTENEQEGASRLQWYRADDVAGERNLIALDGATAATYLITSADAGTYLAFAVTPVSLSGTVLGTEKKSRFVRIDTTVEQTTETLTSLDAERINLIALESTLPEGFEYNVQTGDFLPPVGEKVKIKSLQKIQQILPEMSTVELITAPVVDMNCNVSVGCAGKTPTLLAMTEQVFATQNLDTLFSVNQEDSGLLRITGNEQVGGISLSLAPSAEHIYRRTAGGAENMGASVDEEGFYHLTLENGLDLQVIPAPRDYQSIIQLTEASGLYQGEQGEIMLSFDQATKRRRAMVRVVGVFNPMIEPPPAQFCVTISPGQQQCDFTHAPEIIRPGVHILPSRRASPGRGGEVARVVYSDGSSQEIYPSILEPEIFTQTLHKTFPKMIDSVRFYVDGSLLVVVAGQPYHILPSFAQVNEIAADDAQPAITLMEGNQARYSLPWIDPDPDQPLLVQRRGKIREMLHFPLVIEPIPATRCTLRDQQLHCDFAQIYE